MKICFSDCPSWFTHWIADTYQDEFHSRAVELNIEQDRIALMACAVEFFNKKDGLTAWVVDEKLWFEFDADTPDWTYRILKNS